MGVHKTKKVPSPYADGRDSKVNPDLPNAMKGKGGKPVAKPKPKKKPKKKPTRAEKMDNGLPLKPVKKMKKMMK